MGGIKRLLEEESARQGTDDISQPSVLQAAQRRLDVKRRQYFLERLCGLSVKDCGLDESIASILMSLTDDEILETFRPVLHDLLQERRELHHFYIVPERPVLTREKIMDRAVKNAGTTCSRCEFENDNAIDLEALDKALQELEEEPEKEAMRERYMEMMAEEKRMEQLKGEVEDWGPPAGDKAGIE